MLGHRVSALLWTDIIRCCRRVLDVQAVAVAVVARELASGGQLIELIALPADGPFGALRPVRSPAP